MGWPYTTRRLNTTQEAAVRKALSEGFTGAQLAEAYGVSERTIWRTRSRAEQDVIEVAAGAWRGRFALTPEGPIQVAPWRPEGM